MAPPPVSTEGFFTRNGDDFVPSAHARGPWGTETLHGRVVAGLLARTFERGHAAEGLRFARLTVDMFRMPKLEPVQVSTEAVREGNRIRVLQGTMTSQGVEIARASAVMLKIAEPPAGRVWRPEPWDVPTPDDLPPQKPRPGADWDPMWETRAIGGQTFGGTGRKRAWLRETRALVTGEELSPFVRVAGAADFASPLANSGEVGLAYVNADITLYLHRELKGEWLGFEVASHQSEDGIAVAECTLYDVNGPIGTSSVCAVPNRR